MEILSLIFKFSHSIEMSERILSCIATARIIPGINVDMTLKQRRNNIETTSTTLKQRPPNFQIQPNFNVDTTLKIDVESTLIQRCCACWEHTSKYNLVK